VQPEQTITTVKPMADVCLGAAHLCRLDAAHVPGKGAAGNAGEKMAHD
jgi:hypothetical protein